MGLQLQWNGNAVHNYQKMPHVITVNPVRQLVPKQQFPDAIVKGVHPCLFLRFQTSIFAP
jgi:hypothetical protein